MPVEKPLTPRLAALDRICALHCSTILRIGSNLQKPSNFVGGWSRILISCSMATLTTNGYARSRHPSTSLSPPGRPRAKASRNLATTWFSWPLARPWCICGATTPRAVGGLRRISTGERNMGSGLWRPCPTCPPLPSSPSLPKRPQAPPMLPPSVAATTAWMLPCGTAPANWTRTGCWPYSAWLGWVRASWWRNCVCARSGRITAWCKSRHGRTVASRISSVRSLPCWASTTNAHARRQARQPRKWPKPCVGWRQRYRPSSSMSNVPTFGYATVTGRMRTWLGCCKDCPALIRGAPLYWKPGNSPRSVWPATKPPDCPSRF